MPMTYIRSTMLSSTPVCADCSYSRSSSVTFCTVVGSRGALDQDIDQPTHALLSIWPRNLEPTATGLLTAGTDATFIQMPVQDPTLPALVWPTLLWLLWVWYRLQMSGPNSTLLNKKIDDNNNNNNNNNQDDCYGAVIMTQHHCSSSSVFYLLNEDSRAT